MLLLLAAWALRTSRAWVDFAAEQAAMGDPAEAFAESGYVWDLGAATFEAGVDTGLDARRVAVLVGAADGPGNDEGTRTRPSP